MSEEDLELLITVDNPGEDTLEEDTFHHHPAEKPVGSSTQRRRKNPAAINLKGIPGSAQDCKS